MKIPREVIELAARHCDAAAAVLATAFEIMHSEAYGDDQVAQLTIRELKQLAVQAEEVAETLTARARMKAHPAEVISFGPRTPGDAS